MSVYKYVTQEGALRYLRTWALRITPADQFNDPFEMRPTLHLSVNDVLDPMPSLLAENLKLQFLQAAKGTDHVPAHVAAAHTAIVAFLLRTMTPSEEEDFLDFAKQFLNTGNFDEIDRLRSEFDEQYKNVIEHARSQIPAFSKSALSAMHRALPRSIGVLCLSGSDRHPLMWAHYTDSHKGALLEFDENALCFNRQRNNGDDFGKLHRVWYSDSRPKFSTTKSSNALATLALTKALEWAYEQELRLLWPLSKADQIIESEGKSIHLINVPAIALQSITIGCRADQSFVSDVTRTLMNAKPTNRIGVRVASIDDETFSLNYRDII